MTPREIWTIGHWTCPESAFLQPLHAHDIGLLADVRAQPGSRRNPQFGRDAMPRWLARAGIGYVHLPDLGGRRRKQDVDPEINAGWRQSSFKQAKAPPCTHTRQARPPSGAGPVGV
ncbi:DUF488 family protein [Micromonospora sp. NPDC049836]|uniref:DUF488 family protein n=1 Tax=Micromonospora sp. NPDC049836 TaxID=3364274 RepID=UPI003795D6A0